MSLAVCIGNESDIEWPRGLGTDVIVPRDKMETAVRQYYPLGVDGVVDTALLADHAGALVRFGGGAVSVRKAHPINDPRLRHYHVSVIEQLSNTFAMDQLAELLRGSGLAIRIAGRPPMFEAAQAHRLTEQGGLRGRIVMTFGA